MTKIKYCGLTKKEDINIVNDIKPEYIGFVFYEKSKRYVTPLRARELRQMLSSDIKAVGVFVNEDIGIVAKLLTDGIIDIAQLHGDEDEDYILRLKAITDKEVIKAFKVSDKVSVETAFATSADYVLLDSGMGSGITFDWDLILNIDKPYFLAGGLDTDNIKDVMENIKPYAVDVSSGIETDGVKDVEKMLAFANTVRKED